MPYSFGDLCHWADVGCCAVWLFFYIFFLEKVQTKLAGCCSFSVLSLFQSSSCLSYHISVSIPLTFACFSPCRLTALQWHPLYYTRVCAKASQTHHNVYLLSFFINSENITNIEGFRALRAFHVLRTLPDEGVSGHEGHKLVRLVKRSRKIGQRSPNVEGYSYFVIYVWSCSVSEISRNR